MSLLDNLPHTATHTRPSYSNDELGANRQTDVTIATGLKCWVQNANIQEVEAYQKIDTRITHKVFFTTDPDIRPGDDITVTAGPSFVGKKLEFVSGPTDRSAGLGVLFAGMFEEDDNPRRV